jgi:hypothetical protein
VVQLRSVEVSELNVIGIVCFSFMDDLEYLFEALGVTNDIKLPWTDSLSEKSVALQPFCARSLVEIKNI